MAEMTMIEAIGSALRLEMERDDRVILLGEDIGQLGGVFRATDGLRQYFGPNRVIDTPLAESVIIGSAMGLALSGLVPVPEIQFLGFTQNAFHQICQQLARVRFRSHGTQSAQITIRTPFGGNVRGKCGAAAAAILWVRNVSLGHGQQKQQQHRVSASSAPASCMGAHGRGELRAHTRT